MSGQPPSTVRYAALLPETKQHSRQAHTRAWPSLNAERIRFYRAIGVLIDGRERMKERCATVYARMAGDLHINLTEEKSFYERNIQQMQASEYPGLAFVVPQPVAQTTENAVIFPSELLPSVRQSHTAQSSFQRRLESSGVSGPQPALARRNHVAGLIALSCRQHADSMAKVNDLQSQSRYLQADKGRLQ